MSEMLWYLVWPYRKVRSTPQLIGGLINIAWNVLMAWDRYAMGLEKMDLFGWFHESIWFWSGLISIGWQIGLIQASIDDRDSSI